MKKKKLILTNKDFVQAWPCVFVYPKEFTHNGDVCVLVDPGESSYKHTEIIFPYDVNIKGDLDVRSNSNDWVTVLFTDTDDCNISGNLTAHTCSFQCHNSTHIGWNLITRIINIPDLSSVRIAGDIIGVQWIKWDALYCKGNIYSNKDSDWVDIQLSVLQVSGIIKQATDIAITMHMNVGEIKWFHSILAHNIDVPKINSKWFAPCGPHRITATGSINLPWVDKHTEIYSTTKYIPRIYQYDLSGGRDNSNT